MRKKKTTDKNLLDALTKAYIARAQLFHKGVKASKIDLLITEIDSLKHTKLRWNTKVLGISSSALQRVSCQSKSRPSEFVCWSSSLTEYTAQ